MPELPEVETVRATLEAHLLNAQIMRVEVHWPKMIQDIAKEAFQELLEGQRIVAFKRRGKHLLFVLDHYVLISHLRMEGKYYIEPQDAPKRKHEHVTIYLHDGRKLVYDDVRNFGTFHLRTPDQLFTTPPLLALGLEPHDEGFDAPYLKAKLKRRQQAIKTVLLDQHVILGLGNIYVDEVLFCAGIHPEKKAHLLGLNKVQKLVTCSQRVLAKAVALGGSSIRSYTSSLGVTGRFQNELNVHTKKDYPCKACLTPIKKIVVGGRGTYYCPTCQTKR